MTAPFVPALTLTDRDDAHAVWLAMMDYKYKMYTNAEKYNAEGQYDLAQASMREADRAARLQTDAHAQMQSLPGKFSTIFPTPGAHNV